MLKAVTLDVWNTILDIDMFYYRVAEYLAGLTKKPQKEITDLIHKGYKEIRYMRKLGKFSDHLIVLQSLRALSNIVGIEMGILKKAFTETITSINPQDVIIEGVINVLQELRDLGLKLATIGNVIFWPGSLTRSLLERSNIARYLEIQVYADEVGYSKPKKEIFHYTLRCLGINNPEEVLHVGDSLYEDFAGAILAHMKAALIDSARDTVVEIADGEAFIIPNIVHLPRIVRKIMSRDCET